MFSKFKTVVIENANSLSFSVSNIDEPRFLHGDRLYNQNGYMKGIKKWKKDEDTIVYDFSEFKRKRNQRKDDFFHIDFRSVENLVFNSSNSVSIKNINEKDLINNIYVNDSKSIKFNRVFKKELMISANSQSKIKLNEYLIYNLKMNCRFAYLELGKGCIFNSSFKFNHYSGISESSYDSLLVNVNELTFKDCCRFNANIINKIVYLGDFLYIDNLNGLFELEFDDFVDSFEMKKQFPFQYYINSPKNNYFLYQKIKEEFNDFTEERFISDIENQFGEFEMPVFYKDGFKKLQDERKSIYNELSKECRIQMKEIKDKIENDKFYFINSKIDSDLFTEIFGKECHNSFLKINTYLFNNIICWNGANPSDGDYESLREENNEILFLFQDYCNKKNKHFDKLEKIKKQKELDNKEVNFLLNILNEHHPIELITQENRVKFINALKNNPTIKGLTEIGTLNHMKMMQFFGLKNKVIKF